MDTYQLRQKATIWCVVLLVLHVLAILLWSVGGFSASALGFSATLSYKDAFAQSDAEVLYYFPIVLTVIGLVFALIPLLAHGTSGRVLLGFSLVADILAFLYCTIIIFLIMNEAQEQSYGIGSFSVTTWSILHFICGFAMIILNFFARRALREEQAAEQNARLSAAYGGACMLSGDCTLH